MQLILNIFFFMISGVLYFGAPDTYSYEFCVIIAILFLTQNVLYFIFRNDRNIVDFAFFFAIAFGLTNFIYPVFYYLTNSEFSVFSIPFNENVISRCTAIAYFGYTIYLLALNITEFRLVNNSILQSNIQDFDFNKLTKIIYIFLLVFLAAYIIMGGHTALASEYSSEMQLMDKGVTAYIYLLIVSLAIVLSVFMFKDDICVKLKLFYFVSICFLIIFFLALGSRTLPLMLALCIIVSYNNNIKRISIPAMFLLIFIGAIALTFVVYARTTSVTNKNYIDNALSDAEIKSVWDFGSDLIINNRNLYSLVDFADTHEHTYGLTMLGGLSSPVPFAQSFICSTFDIPSEFLSSSGFSTFIDLGQDSSWGLGTNLVADAYLPFGMIGVAFFFALLGFITGKSKILACNNIYWSICYYILVSNAVFLARGSFFDCFRYIVWGIIIVSIVSYIEKRLKVQ